MEPNNLPITKWGNPPRTNIRKLWFKLAESTTEINQPFSLEYNPKYDIDDTKTAILRKLHSSRWYSMNDNASIEIGILADVSPDQNGLDVLTSSDVSDSNRRKKRDSPALRIVDSLPFKSITPFPSEKLMELVSHLDMSLMLLMTRSGNSSNNINASMLYKATFSPAENVSRIIDVLYGEASRPTTDQPLIIFSNTTQLPNGNVPLIKEPRYGASDVTGGRLGANDSGVNLAAPSASYLSPTRINNFNKEPERQVRISTNTEIEAGVVPNQIQNHIENPNVPHPPANREDFHDFNNSDNSHRDSGDEFDKRGESYATDNNTRADGTSSGGNDNIEVNNSKSNSNSNSVDTTYELDSRTNDNYGEGLLVNAQGESYKLITSQEQLEKVPELFQRSSDDLYSEVNFPPKRVILLLPKNCSATDLTERKLDYNISDIINSSNIGSSAHGDALHMRTMSASPYGPLSPVHFSRTSSPLNDLTVNTGNESITNNEEWVTSTQQQQQQQQPFPRGNKVLSRVDVESRSSSVATPLSAHDTHTPINRTQQRDKDMHNALESLTSTTLKPKSAGPSSPQGSGSNVKQLSSSISPTSKLATGGLPSLSSIVEQPFPKINVLIVEDNVINQAILGSFLKKHKISYKTAKNGKEAVDIWKEGGLHLIFMDLQLPVLSGIEASKQIRDYEKQQKLLLKNDAPPPVIIVALTASNSIEDQRNALLSGCNDYLTKPVNLHWLSKKITEWGCMQALIDFDNWKQSQGGFVNKTLANSKK